MKQDRIGIVVIITLGVLSVGLCAWALIGCSPSTSPTTQPVVTGRNGNTPEDQTYRAFAAALQLAEDAVVVAEAAPGVIPPADQVLIGVAEQKAELLLSQWAAVLDTPAQVQAKTLFLDALGDLAPLMAKNKLAVKLRTTHPSAK